jgi:UDP-2-acetamido-2,6-beta-L-arabino-hexul-4-ose reductase
MRILVTGAEGFVGKNFCLRFGTFENVEVIKYDINSPFSLIEDAIDDVDFVFHLAGVNRPENAEEFYVGNSDFTESLVRLISDRKAHLGFVMSSSIQAALDNDYGKSKKMAEDAVLSLADRMPVYVYRLHNVFGKWCRPNYNSVVATFCYNVMRGLPLSVNSQGRIMELVYIDDVVDEFVSLAHGAAPQSKEGEYCYIKPKYDITLEKLAKMIEGFKRDLQHTSIPEIGDMFTKILFSTFVSYAEADDVFFDPKIHIDERGSFTELIHTESAGQVSVSVSKPGVTRGNHFHDTKMEKFIVLSGEARIAFRHMASGERMEFLVNGEQPRIVTIPAGYTHNIENTGAGDMILLIWANENFDRGRPDTFFGEV